MPTPPLSQAKRQEILRLKGEGKSHQKICDALGVGLGTVSKVVHADPLLVEESSQLTAKELANRAIDDHAEWHKEKFLELQERFKKWVGDTAKPVARKACNKTKATTYFIANDLHSPFVNLEAFGKAVMEAKAAGATEAIIPGDLMDLHSVSRYPKTRKSFSLVEEMQGARATVRTLAENFDRVYLMEGNHDERWFKWLVSMGIPPDILEFFKLEYEHSLSPLRKIAADFPNVKMLDVPTKENASYHHIAQVGDVVFSHAEKFSIIAGKATADVNLYCQKKYLPMGILKPYKVLIQAHTHSAARFYGDFGVLCIENGCLAQIPDYDGNPRLMGREPILGYTLLTQQNGITDQNKTHFYRVQ